MNIEYLGANIFYREVKDAGQVWVAEDKNHFIYTLELDGAGYSLPVWSQRERLVEFLGNARLVGSAYEPHPIPVDVFLNSWLPDQSKGIEELLINQDGLTKRALVLTVDEFIAAQTHKKAS